MTETRPAAGWRAATVDAALRHPVLTALAIFLASRFVVFLGVELADLVIARRPGGPRLWDLGELWFHRLLRWDTGWYLGIANKGYSVNPDRSVETSIVFFPLLPLMAKFLATLTGLRIFDAMLLVGVAGGIATIALLAALVRPVFGAAAAIRAAALMAFLPTSVFLSAAYTEPVALALVLAAFHALAHRRFWLAALACGAAAAARSATVALVPVIMAAAALASPLPLLRRVPMVVLLGAVATGGLLAFIAWQGWVFGDPFAFAKGQQAWSGDMGIGRRILNAAMLRPLRPLTYGTYWFLACAALVALGAFRLPWTWTAYAVLALAIPYVSLAPGIAGFSSMPRYALMVFPAVVTLALLLEGRPRLTLLLIGAGAGGLFVTTAHFSQWHWAG
ncbi:MAG: mannosyltransferase family protein [Phreatobacter sp.]|nr:mannosyltransferase family protein [Phreatobacter sp.]